MILSCECRGGGGDNSMTTRQAADREWIGGKRDGCREDASVPAGDPSLQELAKPPTEMTAAAAAVEKIGDRLAAVWRELDEAGDPLADPEVVHRLRVATRRSLAALAAFGDLTPKKLRRRFERQLRRVRRAAGEARDLDVLIDRLRQRWPTAAENDPAAERLLSLLADQQVASRGPIRDCRADLLAWDWPARTKRLLAAIGAADSLGYGRYARRRLRQVGRRFFAAAGPFKRAAGLHQFRICGKRLRYSLDLFADALRPQPHDRCLKLLKKLQEQLGGFTDHVAAAERFRQLAAEPVDAGTAAVVDSLREEERRLARLTRRQFRRWWTTDRQQKLQRLLRKAAKR